MIKENIKAFMFDLDGTVINAKYEMSEKTIYALKKLKEKGYTMVVNSGRPIFLSDWVTDEPLGKNFFDYVYGNNGSEFYYKQENRTIYINSLSIEQIGKLDKIFNHPKMTLGLYELKDGQQLLTNKELTSLELIGWSDARGLERKRVDYSKDIKHEYSKIVGLHETKDYDEIMDFISSLECDFYDCYPSSDMVVEIVPKHVSKRSSVDDFCVRSGIKKEEIIAFGDSINDVAMLKCTNGVVMGNAKPYILNQFETKTDSVDDDGIYNYLIKEGFID